jgi:8-amino-7-oxononanoate synthase
VIGAEEKTLHVMKSLRKNGIQVGAIRPPTVPKGTSRLRLSIHSQLVPEDIHFIADAIRQAMSSL